MPFPAPTAMMALSSTTTAKAPLAAGQLLRCTPASLPLVAAPSAARHGFRMHSSECARQEPIISLPHCTLGGSQQWCL